MTDLEEMLRTRQDALRGRPLDWRDDIADWWQGVDLTEVAAVTALWVSCLALVAIAGLLAWGTLTCR